MFSTIEFTRSAKFRGISGRTQLLLITSLVLLGYNLSFAQPGSIDTSFDPGTGANSGVYTTSIQSDGRIIIGGIFTSFNGTARNRIARLNMDGSLDTSFDPGTGVAGGLYPNVWTTSIQSDGKIIINGNFYSYNGTAINYIARLNTDGSLDTTFDAGTGPDYWIRTTSIQSDGKIIIGGKLISYNGTLRLKIARLNIDGSLDTSFDPGTGANNEILSTSIQSDGKIIIGGYFTSYNGMARNHIARLNTDGSLDTSFNPGTGANSIVYTTSIQSDGKIFIGGIFSSYNGTARRFIARLNTDGSLDTSFDPGTGPIGAPYPSVQNISIQSDGKIIIGGQFDSYNGTARNNIARLSVDGSLDPSFDQGTGANADVSSISIQSDGKIIIGGHFTSYNGTGRNYIARLFGCPATTSSQTDTACESYIWNGNTYTTSGSYVDTISNAWGCDSIMTLNLTINTVDTSITDSTSFLTANATNATYQWLDCDNNMTSVAGGTGQTFSPTTSGNYAVQIAQNGCTDTSACYNITVSGVPTNYRADNIVVYPNPAKGVFSIEYNSNQTTPYSITDITGKLVTKGVLTGKRTVIDLSEAAHGIYLLKIEGQTIKLIRQ